MSGPSPPAPLATHLVYPASWPASHMSLPGSEFSAHSERRNERAAPVASDSKRVASTVPTSEDLIAQVPVSEPSEADVLETDDWTY
jgi:hypothetical protein